MQLGEQASALVRVSESSFTDQLTIKNDKVSLKLAHSCKRAFGNFYQQVSTVSKNLAELFGGLSTILGTCLWVRWALNGQRMGVGHRRVGLRGW